MLYKLMENRVYRTYTGGANIDKFYGKPVCENSSFPEDWTASVIKAFNPGREGIIEGYGRISDGSLVKDVINGEFKCLVKLLDAAERLVIQVHPTVEFAKKYFNSDFGKTECWYFLNCSEGAHVYVGFKEGVTKEQWRDVFDRQDIEKMLDMLHKVPVKSGDCIFISGGVPHAIGEGCFMIEVQEPSDLMGVTERKTPSGRMIDERKLHGGIGIENMMNMFDYNTMSFDETVKSCKLFGKELSHGVIELVGEKQTDKFSIHCLRGNGVYKPLRDKGVIIVTEGMGNINGISVTKGERLLFDDRDEINLTGNDNFCAIVCS